MLEQWQGHRRVMGMGLHPYIIGQPFRLRQLRRALTHIADCRDRIWITRAGDIFDSFSAQIAAHPPDRQRTAHLAAPVRISP